ncbi:hypothetical protein ACWCQS_13045 [Streptomyces sp. NPDC002076]
MTAGLPRTGVESSAGIRKVGRRPKVYEPVAEAITVHIPERRYEMPADARTEAVLPRTQGESARDAALRVAHRRGETLGGAARERVRPAGCLHGLGSDRTAAVSTHGPTGAVSNRAGEATAADTPATESGQEQPGDPTSPSGGE